MSEHWAYFAFWVTVLGIGIVFALAVLGWLVLIHDCLRDINVLLRRGLGLALLSFVALGAEATEPLSYYTIAPPCRWIDTRSQDKPLHDDETRYVNAQNTAACRPVGPDGFPLDQVPLGAKALAVNVTVVDATGRGHLVVYNGTLTSPYVDTPQRPPTSNLTFPRGDARSNFMVVELGQLQLQDPFTPWWPDTAFYARIAGGGTAHVIADIVGYYARP